MTDETVEDVWGLLWTVTNNIAFEYYSDAFKTNLTW